MPTFVNLIILILFSFLLIKATQILIKALNNISQFTGLQKYALASILVGLATSLPELFVSLTAALDHKQNLALGNILGSNIADLSLIIGGVAVIGGRLTVRGDFFKKDLLIIFLASILPLILIIDKTLSRFDGLLLLLIFFLYNRMLIKQSAEETKIKPKLKINEFVANKKVHKEILLLVLSIILLLVSAELIVKSASNIAQGLGMPLFLIGLFLVAIGTSLPELTFEISAVKKREMSMVFGDSLGSLVANATLIFGLTVLINPITLVSRQELVLATLTFIFIFFLFWWFTKTKKCLERWEGMVLLAVYVVFAYLEMTSR